MTGLPRNASGKVAKLELRPRRPGRPCSGAPDRRLSVAADEPAVLVESIGAVRRLTLNRPDRHNPLTGRCIRELLAAVGDADRTQRCGPS